MAQTILLTGASGYLGKHIALRLLDAGHRVRASVRTATKADRLRQTLGRHVAVPADLPDRFETVLLDLGRDDGWANAATGVDAIVHTASPFPMVQPRNEAEVVRPAVDGALRAARAAQGAGVSRFVMTSSTAAVVSTDLANGKAAYDEEDWSDTSNPGITPYGKSKTLAERAVWDFARDKAPGLKVTVINPGFIVGAPLDDDYGTSVAVIERALSGRDPMLPNSGFTCVDVGDVAEMHLRALSHPGAVGERFLAVDRFMWFSEIAQTLKTACPDRKITTRVAPDFVLRILGLFDKAIALIVPDLGQRKEVSNAKAQRVLDITFRDSAESIAETGKALVAMGRI